MSYIGSVPTTASFPFDQFSGNGSTTAFTLTYAPASTTSIIVAISGVVQNPNLYSIVGTTLTFSPAPPAGTNNISVLYLGLPSIVGVPNPGTVGISQLSATGSPSSTTFLRGDNTWNGVDSLTTAAGSAPSYSARAWVNFDGTSNSNLTGTYSQTGTTVTVTATAHGLITGNSVYLDITSGTAVDGTYDVTVTGVDTFTVQQASRTTSGNVTLVRSTIRGSGNVSSVSDNATGDHTVNFTTAMPNVNYSVCATSNDGTGGSASPSGVFTYATTSFRFQTVDHSGNGDVACSFVNVAIFR